MSLRIYLVENHPDTRKYLKLYLEEVGHEVFDAGNLADALESIPTARCDVLLTDIGLPDGSGWELMRRLKESGLPHPSYVVAMSGFGLGVDSFFAQADGVRHYLLKPFPLEELDAILGEAARELSVRP